MNIRKFIMEKSETQKRSKKSIVLIALMFFGLMSPKAWGYAEGELPSFSEGTFFPDETFSSDQTFSFSRAVLTDKNGVAICQVNLVENPEFLPQFAEPGSSDLPALDLPECEEQSLDIVAQYAEEAWVKRDVAIVPLAVVGAAATLGCFAGIMMGGFDFGNVGLSSILGSVYGAMIGLPAVNGGIVAMGAGIGGFSGVTCYGATNGIRILYLRSFGR